MGIERAMALQGVPCADDLHLDIAPCMAGNSPYPSDQILGVV